MSRGLLLPAALRGYTSIMPIEPEAWRYTTRGTAVRLFLSCWFLYALHFSTNIVREIYLAVSIGDHYTFRIDEYAGLHPDLFEKPGHGWHINNNPGASMIGSVPYLLNRSWIDRVVNHVMETRNRSGTVNPPKYDSPWPLARDFYEEAWRRGLDVKLGLAALVMQIFCMAPFSAAGVVLMFFVLRRIFGSNRTALWLSILYGFGTPIFYRTGYLNQNLMTAHILFAGFVLLWNSGVRLPSSNIGARFMLAGLAGGFCVLLDYSGVIPLALLWLYGLIKYRENRAAHSVRFAAGALIPLALLWFYQWKSFGDPFHPPQYHMPAINQWVETGFRGFVFPRTDLMWSLLSDYRYGLFLSCPLLLLAFFSFWIRDPKLPRLELRFLFLVCVALWLFFGGVNYTNFQFNTGIRYLVVLIPLLFVPVSVVLMALTPFIRQSLILMSYTLAWCMAMYRDVERGSGILEPVIRVFSGGFQLPVLTTLSRMESMKEYFPYGPSPLPLFALAAFILYVIWRRR